MIKLIKIKEKGKKIQKKRNKLYIENKNKNK